MNKERIFTITPSKLNVDDLYDYMIHNLSFDDVLSLYIRIRNKISGGYKNEK